MKALDDFLDAVFGRSDFRHSQFMLSRTRRTSAW
jgi:hypothetical protein